MNKHPLRINLFGGPGSGKSTAAADIFSFIKTCIASGSTQIENIELVTEWCKPLAYAHQTAQGFDQLRWFTEQLKSEENYLRHRNFIVTDSPLLLNTYYATEGQYTYTKELISIAKQFEAAYPSINFWISRGDRRYNRQGRYQTEEQAKQIDEKMQKFLKDTSNKPIFIIPASETKNLPMYINAMYNNSPYPGFEIL